MYVSQNQVDKKEFKWIILARNAGSITKDSVSRGVNWLFIGGRQVAGFCSEGCMARYEAEHGDRNAKGRLVSGTFFGSIGKGIEDNIRNMGGGLFVDIIKIVFKPVCWLLGLLLKGIFTLLVKGGKAIKARKAARDAGNSTDGGIPPVTE